MEVVNHFSSWILLLLIYLTERFLPVGFSFFKAKSRLTCLILFSYLLFILPYFIFMSHELSFDCLAKTVASNKQSNIGFQFSIQFIHDQFGSFAYPGGSLCVEKTSRPYRWWSQVRGHLWWCYFKVNHQSSHNNKRPFLDSNRRPLISIYCYHVSLSISISPSVLHLICNAHQLFKTMFKSTCFFLVSYTGSHSKTMKAFIMCTLNY